MSGSGQIQVTQLLSQAIGRLSPEDGRHVAECLLSHALGRDRAWLFAHARDTVDDSAAERFRQLIERRIAGEPVAYLIGSRGFWTLDLEVGGETLIPRPETERLVELALARLPADRVCRVLDLGTGTGAIALAIASERPQAQVIATDASAGALAIAQRNAAAHGIDNAEFRHGHWWQPVAGESFDLIASNPPYIAEDDPHLQRGDLRYEPMSALASGHDGLDAIREIAAGALAHLRPQAWLLLEHGWEQGAAVRQLLEAAGFVEVATERDLEDRDRVTLGRHPD